MLYPVTITATEYRTFAGQLEAAFLKILILIYLNLYWRPVLSMGF